MTATREASEPFDFFRAGELPAPLAADRLLAAYDGDSN